MRRWILLAMVLVGLSVTVALGWRLHANSGPAPSSLGAPSPWSISKAGR